MIADVFQYMDTNQITLFLKNEMKMSFIEPLQVRLMLVFEYIWENQLLFPGSWIQETVKMLLDLDPGKNAKIQA